MIKAAGTEDFEIRFTATGGLAVYGFDGFEIASVPFEVWNAGEMPDDVREAISTQRQSLRLLQDASAPSATFSQIKLAEFLVEAGQFSEAEGLLFEAEAAGRSSESSHGGSHVVGELVSLPCTKPGGETMRPRRSAPNWMSSLGWP